MKQTWRWFGSADQVSLQDIRQAGAEGIVSALHHIPTGDIWSKEELQKRKKEITYLNNGQESGLTWEIVESLPVSEDIKKQQGKWMEHISNYKESLRNLASVGIKIVCYNFMPVLDWTRTHLEWELPSGATCMRFDMIDFAAFDIHILKRENARQDYSQSILEQAQEKYKTMSPKYIEQLTNNITCGLPGAVDNLTLDDLKNHLAEYDNISAEKLRHHFVDFLEQVVPVAEEVGILMCCHPDDPPFSLLGLPRIMSTENDYALILGAVDSISNGMALCSGSLSARPDNNLVRMMERFGHRVHFMHLRSVQLETDEIKGSFHEAEHLGGNSNLVSLLSAALKQESKRRSEGRDDHSIPIRPDHGQNILDDFKRNTQPGYPAIGRVKGLAELRGVITTLLHTEKNLND